MSTIKIKPSMRNSFRLWCVKNGYGGVNSSCIAAGKKKGGRIAKKAVFASSAKKWNK